MKGYGFVMLEYDLQLRNGYIYKTIYLKLSKSCLSEF